MLEWISIPGRMIRFLAAAYVLFLQRHENVICFQHGWTPLLWACEKGHKHIVDYLLDHGANVDVEDVSFTL